MTKSSAIYVGMDVHKESIGIAVAAGGMRGEVRHCVTIGGGLGDVDRALRRSSRRAERFTSFMKPEQGRQNNTLVP